MEYILILLWELLETIAMASRLMEAARTSPCWWSV